MAHHPLQSASSAPTWGQAGGWHPGAPLGRQGSCMESAPGPARRCAGPPEGPGAPRRTCPARSGPCSHLHRGSRRICDCLVFASTQDLEGQRPFSSQKHQADRFSPPRIGTCWQGGAAPTPAGGAAPQGGAGRGGSGGGSAAQPVPGVGGSVRATCPASGRKDHVWGRSSFPHEGVRRLGSRPWSRGCSRPGSHLPPSAAHPQPCGATSHPGPGPRCYHFLNDGEIRATPSLPTQAPSGVQLGGSRSPHPAGNRPPGAPPGSPSSPMPAPPPRRHHLPSVSTLCEPRAPSFCVPLKSRSMMTS